MSNFSFQNSSKFHWCGFDVGGSLAKLVFVERLEENKESYIEKILQFITSSTRYGSTGIRDIHKEIIIPELGRVHFIQFATKRIIGAVKMIKKNKLNEVVDVVNATGGGSYKYKDLFQQELNLRFVQINEFSSIVTGMIYLMQNAKEECFTLAKDTDENSPTTKIYQNINASTNLFPFLVVNIGTGVSILKVNSPDSFERVSGTALGGGLCRLLTKSKNFDDALNMAESGDDRNVSMLVKDIYNADMKNVGFNLPGDLIASFFSKNIAIDESLVDIRKDVTDNDICRALCIMIAQNITQIALLNARLHNTNKVYFTGNFLRHNPIALRTISHNLKLWTSLDNIQLEAFFFEREGYLGSFGAFLYGFHQHSP